MTASPSDPGGAEEVRLPDAEYAGSVAEAVGGEAAVAFDTIKIGVAAERWVSAVRAGRDELGLVFFSWLSAVDWANEVAVGDPPQDEVEERFEVLCTVGDLTEGRRVTFSTVVSKEDPRLGSLVSVYPGADWHEREAHEMFGIEFEGHPNLVPLYLPEGFAGHPLRKSFPLLSREIKPWPGKVDVEAMPGEGAAGPSTENPEAEG